MHSRFGPRANPNFYRIDIFVRSPPGLYYVSDFRERTAEVLEIVSVVRAHATPVSSVHDIADSLASDLQAKFPAAIETSVAFQPDLKNQFSIEGLAVAECNFYKPNPRTERPIAEQDSIYEIKTEWHLHTSPELGFVTSLVLRTEERCVSTDYGQILSLETPSFRSSLKHVHPTFGLHENIARLAEQLQRDKAESGALLLAECLFHLGDRQSPCKRLQHVRIIMREVTPLAEGYRTKREALILKVNKEADNRYSTYCSVQLNRDQYEQSQRSMLSNDVQYGRHRAYLALGSNLGNRVDMIESALREMSDRKLTVLRTSALYETKPMYLEDQETFINGTCEVCSTDANSHTR